MGLKPPNLMDKICNYIKAGILDVIMPHEIAEILNNHWKNRSMTGESCRGTYRKHEFPIYYYLSLL
jgi:hypothetical protein